MFSVETTNQFSYKARLNEGETLAQAWETLGLDGESQNDVAALNLVRAYCGWHVAPEMECDFSVAGKDLAGRTFIVAPFQMVALDNLPGQVEFTCPGNDTIEAIIDEKGAITLGGQPKHDESRYTLKQRGADVFPCAGLAGDEAKAFGAVVKQVSQALAQPANVVSEKAGAVQITYDNGKRSGILGDRIKAVLAPYKLELNA